MNALWGYMTLTLSKDTPFPDYVLGVFLAFDAGEVISDNDSDTKTKELMNTLHTKA